MASGFFAILDDISAIMDDVATMTKIATKKTSGILGDDLAVNAEKSTGFTSSRELPVLWKIAKGSLLNKVIILPIAFTLSFFYPPAILVVLVLGGLFLSYEGGEKLLEWAMTIGKSKEEDANEEQHTTDEPDTAQDENSKVRSAVLTDFILSLEIVIIAMGTVLEEPILTQIIVVSIVALLATVGVYGLVALIVRLDDIGFYLLNKYGNRGVLPSVGRALVWVLPRLIKLLSVVGLIALLLVSGEIFMHYVPGLHYWVDEYVHFIPGFVQNFLISSLVGLLLALGIHALKPKH